MRARRGQRLSNGVVVLPRTTSASIQQMRCPRCQGMAVAVAGNPKAKSTVYRCNQCGSQFGASRL